MRDQAKHGKEKTAAQEKKQRLAKHRRRARATRKRIEEEIAFRLEVATHIATLSFVIQNAGKLAELTDFNGANRQG